MPLLYGIARGDCLYLFCFCASLPHMSIRAGVVVAVALQKIDNSPDTKSGSKGDNKGLQYVYCAVEKFHKSSLSAAVRLSNCLVLFLGMKKAALCVRRLSPRCVMCCGAAVFCCGRRLPAGGAHHVTNVYGFDFKPPPLRFCLSNDRPERVCFRHSRRCGNVGNWLSYGAVGNAVCRTWESGSCFSMCCEWRFP